MRVQSGVCHGRLLEAVARAPLRGLLAAWLFVLAVAHALAQQPPAPSAQPTEPGPRFASVWRVRGELTATLGDAGRTRRLQEGDPVFVGERVRAETTAEAVLRTDDAGLLAVRPGGSFVAERFSADGSANDAFSVRVVSGALRLITGWIGRSNRAQYRVLTPSATIGIRGTDHETYVMTPELAAELSQPAGTYDKVNRGGTSLEVGSNTLDIEPGKVGFVRRTATTRALMTLALPVLLERVPSFYVPGQFDAELDQLSASVDQESARQLEERRRGAPATPGTPAPSSNAAPLPGGAATAATGTGPAPASAQPATPAAPAIASAECGAGQVARSWLGQLDTAMGRRNAAAVARLFGPQAVVRATVRDGSGNPTTVELGRDEFVQSAVAALRRLTDYQQRRLSIVGQPETSGSCARLSVRSAVIEQGRQNGQPYRFESIEDYVLEQQSGRWVAIRAATTQQ